MNARNPVPPQSYLSAKRRIVFAGHFSAGKSTLLNAIASRTILPTGDLPETGVPSILWAASADRARLVMAPGRFRDLPCHAAAIAAATSIYNDDGCRRGGEPASARLELSLAGAAIPCGLACIDTPGINDLTATSDKVMALAMRADELAWVLNTRQCLAEPEVDFLHRYISVRGPCHLTLILNVFLEQDTVQAWTAFALRDLPRHLQRIASRTGDMGLDAVPSILVVSARAAAQRSDARFGLATIRSWLRQVRRRNPAKPNPA